MALRKAVILEGRTAPVPAAERNIHTLSIEPGLPVVALEAVELRAHHAAGGNQRMPAGFRVGDREKNRRKALLGAARFARIAGGGTDQTVDDAPGPRDALARDAAAVGVAQEETATDGERRCTVGRGARDAGQTEPGERGGEKS